MSIPEVVEELKALEEVEIRGQLSIEDLVRRQIDRCNISMSGPDPSVFEANVRALMTMLPSNKYQQILSAADEYNSEIHDWQYEQWCGINMGTPDDPITTDGGKPKEDWSNVISPKPVSRVETDYEKLYEVILRTFEAVGLTWRVEPKVAEFGKVIRAKIPSPLVDRAARAVVDVLLRGRAKMIERANKLQSKAERRALIERANQIGYTAIIEELRELTPATPVFEVP